MKGRKSAMADLNRSEEQFRLLVQSVTDYAIFMLDLEGRVASWNAGAERIKGYQSEEILGRHFSLFYEADDQAKGLPEAGLRTAREIGRWECEGWRLRKDGTQFWANVVIDQVRNDRGELIGFAKITKDITESLEAQAALEEVRNALLHSQKMEALGKLTGGIAHDFNNLLTVIIVSLELATKRMDFDAQISPLLLSAKESAERGAALTGRMLSFARRRELLLELVSIEEIVNNAETMLRRALGSNIDIDMHVETHLPLVEADRSQIELALLNLAVNARDAMPKGGKLDINCSFRNTGSTRDMHNRNYVCLAVTDTGEGMDRAILDRATEPFFTTKEVGKGTGLGLSMVHGLAEQLGGKLLLHSIPSQGTTVEIWLPVSH